MGANQHSERLPYIPQRIAWCEKWVEDGRKQITPEWLNLLEDTRWLLEQLQAAQENLERQTTSMSATLSKQVRVNERLEEQLKAVERDNVELRSSKILRETQEALRGLDHDLDELETIASRNLGKVEAERGRLKEQLETLRSEVQRAIEILDPQEVARYPNTVADNARLVLHAALNPAMRPESP